MTERRRFQVVAPDWGEAHLTPEAVVAYVDGELAAGPNERATRHLERCLDCAAEVMAQRQARAALRRASAPSLPSSLMSSLRAIPECADLPAPPAGLAMSPDGELVALLRPAPVDRPSRRSRRMRLGTGAAVSGLALGALAFGAPSSGAVGSTTGATPITGPNSAAVARFAVTPPSVVPPAPTSSPSRSAAPGTPGPATARPTMRNASLPPAGR